jgi:hypothetical protein
VAEYIEIGKVYTSTEQTIRAVGPAQTPCKPSGTFLEKKKSKLAKIDYAEVSTM